MTVSFMRCLTSVKRNVCWCVLALFLFASRHVPALASDLPQMRVQQQGVTLLLDAQIPLAMPEETEAILRRGVPLVVVQEVKVLQSRWYWQEEVLTRARRDWTLSYQALTQRWRVMLRQGEQVEQFEDARSAWAFLTQVKQWPIGDVTQLGALRDAQAELSWSVDRRAADPSSVLLGSDAGAAWRLSTVGRVPIPNTTAPVRDAMGSREPGS